MRRLTLLALLLAAIGLALAGCAGSSGQHPTTGTSSEKTMASRSPVATRPPVFVVSHKAMAAVNPHTGARFLSPTRLAFWTWGSGTCPAVPRRLVIQNSDSIRIDLTMGSWRPRGSPPGRMVLVAHRPRGGGCTLDLRPTAMAIAINPRQINVHRQLTIRLFYGKKPAILTAPAL